MMPLEAMPTTVRPVDLLPSDAIALDDDAEARHVKVAGFGGSLVEPSHHSVSEHPPENSLQPFP
jgi:hypothetical protein